MLLSVTCTSYRKEPEVSHRLFYEGISFHWHEKGKVHLLYNPSFQVRLWGSLY